MGFTNLAYKVEFGSQRGHFGPQTTIFDFQKSRGKVTYRPHHASKEIDFLCSGHVTLLKKWSISLSANNKILRQHKANSVCGYHRKAIKHIENGRTELQESRIMHTKYYGFTMESFEYHMKADILVTEI